MHVGVRWQPFGFPKCEEYDANRPVLKEHSSYAQFWVSWNAAEPNPKNTDYSTNMSGYLKAIDHAVNLCVERGIQSELVLWHCPSWASESGKAGGWKPRVGEYPKFVTRMAKHFKGRVGAYQLYHEVNLQGMMNGANMDFIKKEIFTNGAKAVREVYNENPKVDVLVSTSGTSPCQPCGAREGLQGVGAIAVDDYYNQLIADKELMKQIEEKLPGVQKMSTEVVEDSNNIPNTEDKSVVNATQVDTQTINEIPTATVPLCKLNDPTCEACE